MFHGGSGGVMTREWQEFFRQLFDRVGGYESDTVDELSFGSNLPLSASPAPEDQIPQPVARNPQHPDQYPEPTTRYQLPVDCIPEPVARREEPLTPAPDALTPSPKQEDVVWDDIQFPVSTGKVPAANFPDYTAFTANTQAYKFDVGEYIDLEAEEMAHWWKEGTGVWPHLHIALDGANATGASRYAKFTIYLAYADDDGVFVEVERDIEIEIPDGTADRTHKFGQSATEVDFSGLGIGTQVVARVERIAATGGVEYSNDTFITQVGIHAQKDSRGSWAIGTK
jgi:GNAT superfamily N-acetyltransferase